MRPERRQFLPHLRLNRTRAFAAAIAATLVLSSPAAFAQQRPAAFNVVPISVTRVVYDAGSQQLVANVLIGTHVQQVPLVLGSHLDPNGGVCPILDLQIGEIHLDLLGLNVDTSEICLKITAVPGGGLLGDLLCGLANALQIDPAGGLSSFMASLTVAEQNRLLNGLTSMLNQVFGRLTSSNAVSAQDTVCPILALELGPITLNLLGLVVELDNCEGGPVELRITAEEGGGLLGDLLCDLTNLLQNGGSQQAINQLLRQIARLIGSLLG